MEQVLRIEPVASENPVVGVVFESRVELWSLAYFSQESFARRNPIFCFECVL